MVYLQVSSLFFYFHVSHHIFSLHGFRFQFLPFRLFSHPWPLPIHRHIHPVFKGSPNSRFIAFHWSSHLVNILRLYLYPLSHQAALGALHVSRPGSQAEGLYTSSYFGVDDTPKAQWELTMLTDRLLFCGPPWYHHFYLLGDSSLCTKFGFPLETLSTTLMFLTLLLVFHSLLSST